MCRWVRLVVSVVLSTGALLVSSMHAADLSASKVELNCKLVPARGEPRHGVWLVELRDAAGRPLRQALRLAGDTVHFRDLLPGIYRIYLWGKGGRRYSVSVDLTPMPGKRSCEFAEVLHLPEAEAPLPGEFQVDVGALAIPKDALHEMQLAEKASLNGDEAEAAIHLERATDCAPAYADAWNNLGAYNYRNGRYEQALRDFTRVAGLKPDSSLGWMNLGATLLAVGRFDEAVEASKKALTMSSNDAVANSQLGLSYFYLHRYAEAEKYLKIALNLDPAMVESPQLLLAHIALAERSYGEAMAYLRGYLKCHPNSPQANDVSRTLTALVVKSVVATEGTSR